MSATDDRMVHPAARGAPRPVPRRSFADMVRPAEGWLAVLLSLAIVQVMAWAIDDPALVNGRETYTDCLALFALLGWAVGLVGPKVGWGRWTTHVIGALFAGLLIPIYAGWAVVPGLPAGDAFRFAVNGSVEAYLDIVWRGLQYTSQEVHHVIILGGIVWGTAQFFAYAVFGHRRPLSGVVIVGVVMLVNMAFTTRDQMSYLLAFTIASLFLLIGMHAFDERSTWVRRRIGDPAALASMYLKGGALFVAFAVVASLLLTARAASAPLAGAWDSVDQRLIAAGETLARLFPVGPDTRGGGGVTFGSAARILPKWFSGQGVAFTATVPSDMPELRWRAATYNTYALGAWVQTSTAEAPHDAGDPLLTGTGEAPDETLTTKVSVSITPDEYRDSLLLAPGAPLTVDRQASTLLSQPGDWFAAVNLDEARGTYKVEAAPLNIANDANPDGITGNELAAASQQYPEDVVDLYTDVPQDAMGPASVKLLADILATAPDRNPYTLAVAMQSYLQDDTNFTYDINGTGPCDSSSAVECFARTHRGYCLHYASAMAILLRAANPENPIPTRLVQGFLPGTRTGGGTIETVKAENAHAWVEVYFPGYGWIPFDPTGGGQGRPTVIAAGPSVAPAAPTPVASREPNEPDPTRRVRGSVPGGGEPAAANSPVDRAILIVLAVVLGVAVIGLALAAWARGPRNPVSPDTAWRTMARSASRFGFAPRPTQTVYEYAASIAELVPVARDDLRTVADAKVETQYANVRLAGARLEAVTAATRRLRISLLRLLWRRPRRTPGRLRRR